MKIFQIITVSEYGGAQSIVASLIKAYADKHQVFVLYGGEGEAWNSLGDNFTRIRLNKHRKNISVSEITLLLKLIYYRLKYRPDIVHLHSSKMGILGRLAFSRKTTVFTVHGFDSVRIQYRKFLVFEKMLKNKIGRMVAVSKYDQEALRKEDITKKVCCIYNGVKDLPALNIEYKASFVDQLNEIKKQYNKIVMCIARISTQKRFDIFLAIAQLMPEYAFVWIGNKEQMINLPTNVFCLGEADQAFAYIRFADVFILPTNYEGLPMSLLEALAYAKPIVATNVGGISEILDNHNGFVVENKPEEFAEKIRLILSDPVAYNRFSEKAREQYLKHFTIEKMVDGYSRIYNELTKLN